VADPEGCLVNMDHFLPSEIRIRVEAQSREVKWETVLASPLEHEAQLSTIDFQQQIPDELRHVLARAIDELRLPPIEKKNVIDRLFKHNNAPLTLEDYWTWFGSLQAKKVPKLKQYLANHLKVTEKRTQLHRPEVFNALGETAFKFFVNRVRYLSANRVAPTALFQLGIINQWSEVGTDGSNVAAALDTFRDKNILYWHPKEVREQQGKLIDVVLIWLRYFGLIENIQTKDYGKLGTFLSIKSFGVDKELDLTSVGFGTSQILPIVVQGLLTPPGGLFIVEQPEVHMHPKVQSQLAHFFFALSKIGVQCIAETHSEYIVNQLRLLIAQGNEVLRQQTRIYFAKRTQESGTEFEEIQVDRGGRILNWPEDFMDESNKLAQELLEVAIATQ
jgi:predicted ATPase